MTTLCKKATLCPVTQSDHSYFHYVVYYNPTQIVCYQRAGTLPVMLIAIPSTLHSYQERFNM